jgi:RND superfamily putative drug exporter
MRALTRFALRHKLFVLATWIVLALAGAATVSGTIDRLTTGYSLPGHEGFDTDQQILQLYGNGGASAPAVPVVTLPSGTTVDSPGVSQQLTSVFAAARSVPGVRVVDYTSTGDRSFVTADGRSTFALVFVPGAGSDTVGPADAAVAAAVAKAAPAGWTAQTTGFRQLYTSTPPKQSNGVVAESMIGGLGALVVLAFVFGSFLAVLPLVMAGLSILTTFLLLGGLSRATDISFIAEYLVALIGLGVAIDYSLLVVSRWREERARGIRNDLAVENAMATAGRAVLFSGVLVGVGLLALVALPVPFLRGLGYAGLLIPLVSMAVAVTLLPVVLATVGPRLDWPRRRARAGSVSPRWEAWARLVVRFRWVSAAVGAAVLALLIVPLFSIHVGEPSTSTLATSGPARQALTTLTDGGVPSGALTPIEVLTRGDAQALVPRLSQVHGVATALAPTTPDYRADGTSLVTVLPTVETSLDEGQHTVTAVRDALAPDAEVVGVGGLGAEVVDFTSATYGSFWRMLVVVAVVTFVMLMLAFRSILLPLKAIVMNFASVAAAYGVLVLVWQDGHGSDLVWGVQATGSVTFWVPVFVFAFLFGLSMDYEVFILSRVREEYDSTGSTHLAVVRGLGRTGRLVSSAALILVLAFLAMSTGPQTDTKILATGLGVGILLDATVVRCLLMPAVVALMGRWNWWLPGRGSPSQPAGPLPQSHEVVPVAASPGR